MNSLQRTTLKIRLENPGLIPKNIIADLRSYKSLFADYKYLDQIIKIPKMHQIVQELNNLCIQRGVIGYHFTRAIPEEIVSMGLRISYGECRRKEFLEKYGDFFSAKQQERIKSLWKDYFINSQSEVRDGRVWFNFTLKALAEGSADRLLKYFGGESIYNPLTSDPEIAAILQRLGTPIILECVLDTESLKTYSANPWGRIWLSSYHVAMNQEAFQYDVDAFLQEDVHPNRILRIRIPGKCENSSRSWRIENPGG